jgi:hypothetical protein
MRMTAVCAVVALVLLALFIGLSVKYKYLVRFLSEALSKIAQYTEQNV